MEFHCTNIKYTIICRSVTTNCDFFLKSKQQIIREKGGLKPTKKSMAIRQQLKIKGQPSKQMKIKEIIDLRAENTTPNQFFAEFVCVP